MRVSRGSLSKKNSRLIFGDTTCVLILRFFFKKRAN